MNKFDLNKILCSKEKIYFSILNSIEKMIKSNIKIISNSNQTFKFNLNHKLTQSPFYINSSKLNFQQYYSILTNYCISQFSTIIVAFILFKRACKKIFLVEENVKK